MGNPDKTEDEDLKFALKVCKKIIKKEQFTIFGDDSHYDLSNAWFFMSEDSTRTFKAAGVKHIIFEYPPDFAKVVSDFQANKMSRLEFEKIIESDFSSDRNSNHGFPRKFSLFAELAQQLGIQIHILDERKPDDWFKDIDFDAMESQEERTRIYNKIVDEKSVIADEFLAERIKDTVGDEKTVIFYGAGHVDSRDGTEEKDLDEWLEPSVSRILLSSSYDRAYNAFKANFAMEFIDTIIITSGTGVGPGPLSRYKCLSASGGEDLGGEIKKEDFPDEFPRYEVQPKDLRNSLNPLNLGNFLKGNENTRE